MQNLDPVLDDLSAVQADDLLLDYLGSALPSTAGHLVDDELNALLVAWRGEVEAADMPELVDTETAIAVIARAATTWWSTSTTVKVAALALFLAVIVAVALALTAVEAGGAA